MDRRLNARRTRPHYLPRRRSGGRWKIYVVYDRTRTPDGIIQTAVCNEEDGRAGKPVSDIFRLKQEIDRLAVVEPTKAEPAQ
jgi:hypothetical protein